LSCAAFMQKSFLLPVLLGRSGRKSWNYLDVLIEL
jgi:hypothetical protein